MARAKRILYNGNQNTGVDYIPLVGGQARWAYAGGVRIPRWSAVAAQPSPKITAQPTGSTGTGGGYASGSYILYCSTTNNANSYGAWRVFDGTNADAYGWATAAGDASPWIGIKLPYSLKSISITISNRIRASLVGGPISGNIIGADSATLSGTVIGTFSGQAGSSSGAGFTVYCSNHNDSFQWVFVQITGYDNGGGQNYAAIGEITINGKAAS